jgi:hypothetical protein
MENPKYPALTTVANFYRFLAWFTIAFTILLMILGVISAFISGQYIGGGFFGFLGELLGAIFGSIMFVFFYGAIGFAIALLQMAVAELLQVFMDIEANTRS